jgi:leader peptidase (prepilin peptidase)/N-methyltransferase
LLANTGPNFMNLLASLDPWALSLLALIFGLLIGSFLNVVIHRLPIMMEREWAAQCAELQGKLQETDAPETAPLSLWQPRSRCPHCQSQLGASENIPLLSYLFQKGGCRHCGKPISVRYPLVEALTGIAFAYATWHFGASVATMGAMLFIAAAIALTFIDLDTQLLPDDITLPLLWLGIVCNLSGTYTDLESSVVGAIAGYLLLWSIYWAFKLLTGKEGMGYGDFKLLAAIGAWLGWQLLPTVVLLSSVVGAVVGISLIVFSKHERNTPIPFGPYLATAGIIALFWGKNLQGLYLG